MRALVIFCLLFTIIWANLEAPMYPYSAPAKDNVYKVQSGVAEKDLYGYEYKEKDESNGGDSGSAEDSGNDSKTESSSESKSKSKSKSKSHEHEHHECPTTPEPEAPVQCPAQTRPDQACPIADRVGEIPLFVANGAVATTGVVPFLLGISQKSPDYMCDCNTGSLNFFQPFRINDILKRKKKDITKFLSIIWPHPAFSYGLNSNICPNICVRDENDTYWTPATWKFSDSNGFEFTGDLLFDRQAHEARVKREDGERRKKKKKKNRKNKNSFATVTGTPRPIVPPTQGHPNVPPNPTLPHHTVTPLPHHPDQPLQPVHTQTTSHPIFHPDQPVQPVHTQTTSHPIQPIQPAQTQTTSRPIVPQGQDGPAPPLPTQQSIPTTQRPNPQPIQPNVATPGHVPSTRSTTPPQQQQDVPVGTTKKPGVSQSESVVKPVDPVPSDSDGSPPLPDGGVQASIQFSSGGEMLQSHVISFGGLFKFIEFYIIPYCVGSSCHQYLLMTPWSGKLVGKTADGKFVGKYSNRCLYESIKEGIEDGDIWESFSRQAPGAQFSSPQALASIAAMQGSFKVFQDGNDFLAAGSHCLLMKVKAISCHGCVPISGDNVNQCFKQPL